MRASRSPGSAPSDPRNPVSAIVSESPTTAAERATARLPIRVAGIGAAVPVGRVTNDDLAHQVETSDEWIVERTGIRERRKLAPGLATSDLAITAARAALDDAGMGADDVDLLVVCTCTPDQPMPAAAALVARALGFRGAAMDLNAACSGFVYGLVTVASMLTAAGGRAALLIGADALTRWMDPADRGTLPLFGDGAAALVMRPADDGPGMLAWDLGVDGDGADLLKVPAGGTLLPASVETLEAGDHYVKMEGREVFRRAVRSVEASCSAVLAEAGTSPDEVGLFVPHQANSRIVDAITPRLGIKPDRVMMNIDRYGNTSAASIPIALCEAAAEGRLNDGDLVLLAGFGAGMTWATALLRWGYTGAGPAPTIDV